MTHEIETEYSHDQYLLFVSDAIQKARKKNKFFKPTEGAILDPEKIELIAIDVIQNIQEDQTPISM